MLPGARWASRYRIWYMAPALIFIVLQEDTSNAHTRTSSTQQGKPRTTFRIGLPMHVLEAAAHSAGVGHCSFETGFRSPLGVHEVS